MKRGAKIHALKAFPSSSTLFIFLLRIHLFQKKIPSLSIATAESAIWPEVHKNAVQSPKSLQKMSPQGTPRWEKSAVRTGGVP